MEPFLPFSAEALWQMLNVPGDVHLQAWETIGNDELPVGHEVGKLRILFPKIEDEDIQPEIERLETIRQRVFGAAETTEEPEKEDKTKMSEEKSEEKVNLITYDEFSKVELGVGKILEAEKVPKADKLLQIQVDLGTETRQIVAGIAQYYEPEQLIDKLVVVVKNLQPVKLRSVESNGMLLAAANDDGELSLVTLEKPITPGTQVR